MARYYKHKETEEYIAIHDDYTIRLLLEIDPGNNSNVTAVTINKWTDPKETDNYLKTYCQDISPTTEARFVDKLIIAQEELENTAY